MNQITAAVIVAAGRGTRAGPGLPKQWRTVSGKTVAAWTVEAFRAHPRVDLVALVLHAEDSELALGWQDFADMRVTTGGATRRASVQCGLEALAGEGVGKVLIHDVARPLVSHALIDRVIDALDRSPGAAPALKVVDALWRGEDGIVSGVQDRAGLYRAQTPQGFRFDTILSAHRAHPGDAADDVAVARAAGLDVSIVEGDERNLKITNPGDFARAESLLEGAMDIRTGTGFDVHAFGPGDHVVLCGLEVPHARGLKGHSDADVGMHAVCDAIYGALAEGDIGRHFPPTDPKWKGADSHVFLSHACELAERRGYAVSNVDVTLICERPKIGPHGAAMAQTLARLMGLEPGRVGVKATTTETLGFAGREEGIAALATVTLVSA